MLLESLALAKSSHFLPLPTEFSEFVFPTYLDGFFQLNKFLTFFSTIHRVIRRALPQCLPSLQHGSFV